jgi:hypothetical protein
MNYLKKLQEISKQRDEDGLLHSGVIHYIQQRYSNEHDIPISKVAIYQVLENVPDVFPFNLENLIKDEDWVPPKKMNEVFEEISSHLIMPLYGEDVVDIIRFAREYESQKKIGGKNNV